MIPYAVILNGVKNLEISVAVDGSASLEILRYTQDDIESERLPRLEEHSELSFHPSRCATARNHKITKSQGVGVCDKCDRCDSGVSAGVKVLKG